MLRLTRELFIEEYAHRVDDAVRNLGVEHNKKHEILNAIYNVIPDEEEWKVLDGVRGTAIKNLQGLTRHEYDNNPSLLTEDGYDFMILPGVPMKEGAGYTVPLWFYYSIVVGPGKKKEGRFRSTKWLNIIDDRVDTGPTIDELQRDLENKAITHLIRL